MLLNVIRAVFVLIVAGLAVRLSRATGDVAWWAILFAGVMGCALIVLIVDVLTPRKRIQTISAVYFGLIVGLLLSYLLRIALEPTLTLFLRSDLFEVVAGLLTVIVCYICVSLLLQTKDDFRFIIPYIEFSREMKGARPLVLDTSVIIDGRIADVVDARILDQPLVVPRFVLQELQSIADSADKLRRNRGRRGLDILNRLQKSGTAEVRIDAGETPEVAAVQEVDQKLLLLAKHLGGKVVTNDYNLNKVAKLHGVEVLNLNDLANAMKPIVLPGESLAVKLIKRGEEPGQGIGYLDDGTMVVAEQGIHHLGEQVRLTVTSVLQTSAGRMIFGRLDGTGGPSSGSFRTGNPPPGTGEHPTRPGGSGR